MSGQAWDSNSAEDVAALLAETLRSDCWPSFGERPIDDVARETFRRRAIHLFHVTDPFLSSLDQVAWDEPMGFAIAFLRDVASCYGLLSNLWSPSEAASLHIMTRPQAEMFLRVCGIDDWAAELGHPLELLASMSTDAESDEAAYDREGRAQGGAYRELATRFANVAASYDQVVERRRLADGRDLMRRVDFRGWACSQLRNARMWVGWAQENADDDFAFAIAALLNAMAQGIYVASHDDGPESETYPTRTYVREAIHAIDTGAWLTEFGAELPEWLADNQFD